MTTVASLDAYGSRETATQVPCSFVLHLTCRQFLAGQQTQPLGRLDLSPLGSDLKPGEIIELQGAEGSGKTELLYKVVAATVLPAEWRGIDIGGRGASVYVANTDTK